MKEDWRTLGFPNPESCLFPNIVNLEVFRGACPCRCRHCPVGLTPPASRAEVFEKRAMPLALYDKLSAEIARHPWSTLRIHSVGDPILWNDLSEALRISARNGVRTWLFTSAVTTNRAILDLIAETVAIVEISVNSIDASDYLTTKGIDAFGLVRKNIRRIHQRRQERGSPRVLVSRVESVDKERDRGFVQYWKRSGLADDAFVRSFHTYNDSIDAVSGAKPEAHQPCLVHWARFNVDARGRALVCFNELFKPSVNSAMILGDVRQRTISEIWHSRKMAELRKAEFTGQFSDFPNGEYLFCRDCRHCQPLRDQNRTSEHQVRQVLSPPGEASSGSQNEPVFEK